METPVCGPTLAAAYGITTPAAGQQLPPSRQMTNGPAPIGSFD